MPSVTVQQQQLITDYNFLQTTILNIEKYVLTNNFKSIDKRNVVINGKKNSEDEYKYFTERLMILRKLRNSAFVNSIIDLKDFDSGLAANLFAVIDNQINGMPMGYNRSSLFDNNFAFSTPSFTTTTTTVIPFTTATTTVITDEEKKRRRIAVSQQSLERFRAFEQSVGSDLIASVTNVNDEIVDLLQVYNTLTGLGELLNVAAFKEFKYQLELNRLLVSVQKSVHDETDFKLTRFKCAAIVAKSLFTSSNHEDRFKSLRFMITAAESSPVIALKLRCLLEYIHQVCYMMRENSKNEYDQSIVNETVRVNRLRYTIGADRNEANDARYDYSETANIARIDIDNYDVDVPVFNETSENLIMRKIKNQLLQSKTAINIDTAHVYHIDTNIEFSVETTPSLHDLILIHTNDRLGENTLLANLDYESVLFMQYPELYAVAALIDEPLDDYQSLCMKNFVKFNKLQYVDQTMVYASNNALLDIVSVSFLAVKSNDLVTKLYMEENGLNYLNQNLSRLMGGLQNCLPPLRYSNRQNDNSPMPTIVNNVVSGAYGSLKNRTLQFLIEFLVCTMYDFELEYYSNNYEIVSEIKMTLEALKNKKVETVSDLYKKLTRYNVRRSGPNNFLTYSK
ncbi:parg [Lambdina fiscellaria nucleopolyhedrovirus]|uniref:Parg n=1 Tax=Lambdina fiscellaria nucleopolyhedrovirus TaxID=1642929 RepID=A0A0E3URA5_9ABAC|nr:parg [Lambdina fiscellaria nucleopolyhedrovirus]AKC91665.1 parg [Lambdina fiscellaria nucleopolyhedrovirus]